MEYEPISPLGEPEVAAAIARDDPAELLYVPVSIGLYAEDLEWAERVCARLAEHPHFNVRGNAILGLGHLARRFGALDRALVEPLILRALNDPDAYVRGHAHDVVGDINHFIGWSVAAKD